MSASELGRNVAAGRVSAVESIAAALARIEAFDGEINAFVCLCPEGAMDEARRQDADRAAGRAVGPLSGVPLGVKDLEDVGGLPTTFGSIPFRDYIAPRDSVQVARLRAAGAIVVGKTNTPEFGSTGFTKNRLFGTTRNPWDPARTPGGSSGGSAAALAARMLPLVTASDGGGSIRIPACYVGAIGMKPTFGRIPSGPEAHGMLRWVDTVHNGPLSRTVEDAALFLDVTAGYHPADPASLPAPPAGYREGLSRDPGKLRVAFSLDLGYARVDSEVVEEVEKASSVIAGLGHDVIRIDTVFPDLGRAWAYACAAEQYAELAPLVRGKESELGRAFWGSLEASSHLSAADMGGIQRERFELNEVMGAIFESYDLLMTPTLPTVAFDAGGPPPSVIAGEATTSPLHAVAFTYPFNFSGHPAISLRAGLSAQGLPVGLQLVAERHRDDLLLQVAARYEDAHPVTSWPLLTAD